MDSLPEVIVVLVLRETLCTIDLNHKFQTIDGLIKCLQLKKERIFGLEYKLRLANPKISMGCRLIFLY